MSVFPRLCLRLVVALLTAAYAAAPAQTAPAQIVPAQTASPQPPPNPALPRMFLVGNQDPGVAPALRQLFDRAKINVADRTAAASGVRSTAEGGSWQATLAAMRPGDFVLIQFARSSGSAGETDSLPGVSDDARRVAAPAASAHDAVEQTYGWYLRQFAVEAIARGATPILCAPVLADRTEQTRDGEWTKAIAVQQRIPFVDAAAAAANTTTANTATGLAAGLKGLPDEPLRGYFSAEGNSIRAYRPPAPQPPTGAPAIAPPSRY